MKEFGLSASESLAPAISVDQLHKLVLESLDDDKALDIISIDLKGKTSIADHMIIATGRSARQVASIADNLARHIKEAGLPSPAVEGLPQADWVLVDAGDIIVHVFRPEVRDFYNLEKMWSMNIDGAKTP